MIHLEIFALCHSLDWNDNLSAGDEVDLWAIHLLKPYMDL